MKYLFNSLFFLLLTAPCIHVHSMPLALALKEGVVSAQIVENVTGTHYSAPLIIQVENLRSKNVQIELDNGYILQPKDSDEQDMIITNDLIVKLAPNESKEAFIYAMCIEQQDRAPGEDSKYSVGELASTNMRNLSAFIQEKKQFEPDAQFLMWEIADGAYGEEEIDDFVLSDNGEVWILDLEGERLEPTREYSDEAEQEQRQLMVHGNFEMNFSREKNVHIAMFNENNVIVKELFKNPKTPMGNTKLDYEFNSLEYEEDVYYVKLVVDGKVIMTRTIEMQF